MDGASIASIFDLPERACGKVEKTEQNEDATHVPSNGTDRADYSRRYLLDATDVLEFYDDTW